MIDVRERILARIGGYYSDKLREHGPTARGADWRDRESQDLRFAQLLGVTRGNKTGSVAELGCGYGALVDWLRREGYQLTYAGYDVSPAMIAAAYQKWNGVPGLVFKEGSAPDQPADYVVASGIFNVRLDYDDAVWSAYVIDTIATMAQAARIGFAFNCLTSRSDLDRMQRHLFYADPAWMLAHCLERYGRHVALRHDYGLFEFTVLAWKHI